MIKEPTFAFHAASITGQGAIGTDYAMAWHNDSNGIGSVGQADCPDRSRTTNSLSDLCIGQGRSYRDISQGTPYFTLEGRASGLHRQTVDCAKIAGKVTKNRIGQAARIDSRFQSKTILAIMKPQQAAHSHFMICPINGPQVPVMVRYENHLSDGRVDSINK